MICPTAGDPRSQGSGRPTYGTGGPTQNYTYNAQHQLTQNTLATGGSSTIAPQAYGYYPSGRIKTQTTTGLAGPSSNTYTYDQAGRLSSWNNGTSTTNYAYDDNGNLTQRGTTTASYNQRNQLQTASTTSYSQRIGGHAGALLVRAWAQARPFHGRGCLFEAHKLIERMGRVYGSARIFRQ